MSKKNWLYLGNELRKLREGKEPFFSQVEFANALGISKSLVCKVEAGDRKYSQEALDKIFDVLSLDNYEKLKFLVISGLPYKLKNTEEDCYDVIKLTIELKDNGLFHLAKSLINLSLDTFDDFVDFYVLLSTVNLMENKYEDSEKYISIALNLYKNGFKSISTELDIYHNYGNIFFKMSYSYELKKLEIISSLFKKNKTRREIINDSKYININNEITELYLKTEEYFLKAYNSNKDSKHIIAQLARLYFNLVNIDLNNKNYIDKAYYFLNMVQEIDNLTNKERVELSIFFSIILSIKGMAHQAVILLNNIISFMPDNPLLYYAKAIGYTYKSHNDLNLVNKALDNLNKSLEISNYSNSLKLQIMADSNFDFLRNHSLTKNKFNEIIYNKLSIKK